MGAENVPANMEATYEKWNSWVTLLTGDDGLADRFDSAAGKLEQKYRVAERGQVGR